MVPLYVSKFSERVSFSGVSGAILVSLCTIFAGCTLQNRDIEIIDLYARSQSVKSAVERPARTVAVEERTFAVGQSSPTLSGRASVKSIPVTDYKVVSNRPVVSDLETTAYDKVYQVGEDVNKLSDQYEINTQSHEPVKKAIHTVIGGETLFSIAWVHGVDYRSLAESNDIAYPYVIYPGQEIAVLKNVSEPNNKMKRSKIVHENVTENMNLSSSYKKQITEKKTIQKKGGKSSLKALNLYWVWPAEGLVMNQYSATGDVHKGLDIAGEVGDPVYAASDGVVVYSGEGLRGYGKLVIIKHDQAILSAYGHNSKLFVSEGKSVKAGEKIAEIGSTDVEKGKLHFEIRNEGQPINPLVYLPAR